MMDWLDLLAVQGTLKSLLQHHSSRASILRHSSFFMVQLSYLYVTTGKTTALTMNYELQTFIGKVMPLLFNTLSRFVIAFLPKSRHLLISLLQLLPIVVFTAAVTVHWNTVTSRLAFLTHLPFVLCIPMFCLPTLDSWL